MDDRAAFLVPDRGLDSRSYPLVVEVLNGVPSGMWALCQRVFDNVGPHDDWLQQPALGLMPAKSCAKNAGEHVDHSLPRSENIESSVGKGTLGLSATSGANARSGPSA